MISSILTARLPIGLDASGRHINAVQLGRVGRSARVESALSVPRSDPSVPLEAAEIAALAETLERQGFHGRELVIAVPDDLLMSEVLQVPSSPDATPEQIRRDLAGAHRCRPDAFEYAAWDLPWTGRGDGRSIMTVACLHNDATRRLDTFETAGLSVRALDVSAWAMARACAHHTAAAGAMTALLDLGWSAAHLVVVCDGVVVYQRTLAESGSRVLYMSLGAGLGLDQQVIDYLLDRYGLDEEAVDENVSAQMLSEVRDLITTHVSTIATELTRSFSFLQQEHPDAAVERLLVLGDAAAIPQLAERLGSQIDLDARTVTAGDVVNSAPSIGDRSDSPRLMLALGLAMHVGTT